MPTPDPDVLGKLDRRRVQKALDHLRLAVLDLEMVLDEERPLPGGLTNRLHFLYGANRRRIDAGEPLANAIIHVADTIESRPKRKQRRKSDAP